MVWFLGRGSGQSVTAAAAAAAGSECPSAPWGGGIVGYMSKSLLAV